VYKCLQANLAVQEAKYESAMRDLNMAQAQLDDKQRELDAVRALYDQAMSEKQARFLWKSFDDFPFLYPDIKFKDLFYSSCRCRYF